MNQAPIISKVNALPVNRSFRKPLPSQNTKSRYGVSKLSQSSKKKTGAQQNQQPVMKIVIDGVDLTPHSLLPSQSQDSKGKQSNPSKSSQSKENNASTSDNLSIVQSSTQAADPFSTAFSQSDISAKNDRIEQTDRSIDTSERESDIDDLLPSGDSIPIIEPVYPKTDENITDVEDLEQLVTINLSESDTTILFSINGTCLSTEDTLSNSITEINNRYTKLKKDKEILDIYKPHPCQTDGFPNKSIKIGVNPPANKEIGVEATEYDIYDVLNSTPIEEDLNATFKIPLPPSASSSATQTNNNVDTDIDNAVNIILASEGCLIDVDTANNFPVKKQPDPEKKDLIDGKEILLNRKRDRIFQSNKLKQYLYIIECLLSQKSIFQKQLSYRDIQIYNYKYDDEVVKQLQTEQPSLQTLFSFTLPELLGYVVVDMKWNKIFPDLLVVGYGQIDFTAKKFGYVLFWNIKNPVYPVKRYNLPVGVSSLDFSSTHPYLLAVGTYTGSIYIYDVRLDSNVHVLTNTDLSSKHSEAIWKLKWVYIDQDKGDSLISISSDSKVKEWSTKRGLSSRDLMTLKRINNPNGCTWKPKEATGESLLSRVSGGSSFDFNDIDSSMYIAGTENGTIHKCSISYNEQYISTFIGHSHPVYEIQFNKFDPNIFISCSSDNTIKIWELKSSTPLINIQNLDSSDSINHVCWSPCNSTVFASVTKDGRIDIWDISLSTLNPVITEMGQYRFHSEENLDMQRYAMMKVLFGTTGDVLVCGDDDGNTTIYKINNINNDFTMDKQIERLNNALRSENNN